MQFISNYGLFLLETFTLVVAILVTVLGIVALVGKNKEVPKLKIKKINKHYKELRDLLYEETLDHKQLKQQKKLEKKQSKTHDRKVYVLHFIGDMKASAVENLRQEISAMLLVATPKDECVIVLESAGGMVHTYGLAASQLQRIRDKNIPLTVCVDKVAASGGYLMACVANQILAAPFSIIGSIGVIAQLPNFNRFLKEKNIDFEMVTAGEYKRTLTMFGENTEKGRQKFLEELEDIHTLFKEHIAAHRTQVDLNEVSTGEHWLAKKAFEYKLVDRLITSDDYLMQACNDADVYEITSKKRKSIVDKLSDSMSQVMGMFKGYFLT